MQKYQFLRMAVFGGLALLLVAVAFLLAKDNTKLLEENSKKIVVDKELDQNHQEKNLNSELLETSLEVESEGLGEEVILVDEKEIKEVIVEEKVVSPTADLESIQAKANTVQENMPEKKAESATVKINLGNNNAYFQVKGEDPAVYSDDLREFQHGLDFVQLSNGNYALIWSSSGNPPTGSNGEYWTHDIYYSLINPNNPVIKPKLLVQKPEAQEPVSAAISPSGTILITNEDGWDAPEEVDQRYALFDENFQAIKPYPQHIMEGSHSGHTAFAGGHFVVFYSEGWVDGGGVDNLGSGESVLAAIISPQGTLIKGDILVSRGRGNRDWWPMVAGSEEQAFLLWQRFVAGTEEADLYFSILDPRTGKLTKNQIKIETGVQYYTYNVSYIKDIDKFLILGSYKNGGGFGYLVNQSGEVVAKNTNLPAIVRESKAVVEGTKVVQVTSPSGVMVLDTSANKIALQKTIKDNYVWQYSGVSGIFLKPNLVYLVALSSRGLVEKLLDI